MQRYGLILKDPRFKSASHCAGKYSLLLGPFMVSFGMFTVDK